jgi:hypothetical protein
VPISEYYKGKGKEVMSRMKKQYGSKKGKEVFYATANKKKSLTGPSKDMKKKHGLD